MPCLKILTNVPNSKIPKDFVTKIVPVLMMTLRKPEDSFTCVISGDCQVSVGGDSSAPGAAATLESIGNVAPEDNKIIAAELSAFLHKELGVDPHSPTKVQSKFVQQRQHSKNCLPDENENIMCIITSSSLDRAASNVEEAVPAVYRTTIASMRDSGLHLIKKLPTYNKYKCAAYRRRRKLAGVEKMAYSDMKEVEVPPEYDDFLLADYRDGNDRILIFALKEAREIVVNGKVFLCDGTFKNCLKPFYQFYVIFCDIGSTANENNVIPVVVYPVLDTTQLYICHYTAT